MDFAACGVEPCEHAARATTTARTQADLDIRTPLAAINSNTRASDEACLPGAHEGDHARHFLDGAKASERHVAAHEVSDALGVGRLPAVPAPARPHDRSWRDAVDRHPLGRDLAGEGLDHADLGGLRGVVSRRAAGLATEHRPEPHHPAPATV